MKIFELADNIPIGRNAFAPFALKGQAKSLGADHGLDTRHEAGQRRIDPHHGDRQVFKSAQPLPGIPFYFDAGNFDSVFIHLILSLFTGGVRALAGLYGVA